MTTKIMFLLFIFFSAETLANNEAIKCYQVAWNHTENDGLGLPLGQAVELCSGTKKADETLQCFIKAWSNPKNGGLGLPLGQAVKLCKQNALQQN